MEPQTFRQVQQALKGKHFGVAVDLGIGFGEYASLLKNHCDYLIGVDRHIERVTLSGYDTLYDKLVGDDMRTYILPTKAEAIFLFDAIEHIKYDEGITLLDSIGSRFCMVTTPTKFFEGAFNGHASLWSTKQLEGLGFKTITYSAGYWRDLLYGWKTIGVRDGGRL